MSWAIEAKREAIEKANKQLEKKKETKAVEEAVRQEEKKQREDKERLAKENFEKKFTKFIPVIRKFFKDLIKAGIIEKHKEKRHGFFGQEYYKKIDDSTFENPSITFKNVETTEDNYTRAHKNGAPTYLDKPYWNYEGEHCGPNYDKYYVLELTAQCIDWFISIQPIFSDEGIESFRVYSNGMETILKNDQNIIDFENFLVEAAKKHIFNTIQQETLKNL